jgi:DNA-binding protein YbaB
MTDPRTDFDDLMAKFTEGMRLISELSHRRAELTASAAVENGRVTVTVNADGAVIETKFSSDVDDLDHDTLARAMTSAAQQAFREVGRLSRELMAPVAAHHASMPTLPDLIPGMPDVRALIPQPPQVSMAPPTERRPVDEPADVPRPGKHVAIEGSW